MNGTANMSLTAQNCIQHLHDSVATTTATTATTATIATTAMTAMTTTTM